MKSGIYGLQPIHFSSINFIGNTSHDYRAIDYNFSKLLTQNILYAAYYEPQSISSIVELLGISDTFVQEEIKILEVEGFIDKISECRFQSNILMHDFSQTIHESMHQIYNKYAHVICEKYVPLIFEVGKSLMSYSSPNSIKEFPQSLYIPNQDFNYLMWGLISMSVHEKLVFPQYRYKLAEHYTKRQDGSNNLVSVLLEKNYSLLFNPINYYKNEQITSRTLSLKNSPITLWQYNCCFDSRIYDWNRILFTEYVFFLYKYLKGNCMQDFHNQSEYETLNKNGLLIPPHALVNMIISTWEMHELQEQLPSMPDHFTTINEELTFELLKVCQITYPQHLQNLCVDYYHNSLHSGNILIRILEILLKQGKLKLLTDNQQKTVNMFLFCDVNLPHH